MSQRDARCGAKEIESWAQEFDNSPVFWLNGLRWDREIDNRSDHRRTTVRRRRPGSVVLLFARFRGPQQPPLDISYSRLFSWHKNTPSSITLCFPPPIRIRMYTRIALQPDAQVDRRAAAGNGISICHRNSTPWMNARMTNRRLRSFPF